MQTVKTVDSLVLEHNELLLIVLALDIIVPGKSITDSIQTVFAANALMDEMGEEGFKTLSNKLIAYHAALHIADPTLDVHHDN